MNLLITEDSPNAIELIRRLLDLAHAPVCEIRTTDSIAETLREQDREAPDLILLDLNLADATPEQTIRTIPHLVKKSAVVAISESDPERYMLPCHHAGAGAYLWKPMFLRPGFEAFLQHALATARLNWKREHEH